MGKIVYKPGNIGNCILFKKKDFWYLKINIMGLQKKLLLTIIPVFLFCFIALAQTKDLKGIVHGPENDPLAGVTVQVKGTNTTALTAADGSFVIQTRGNAKTLVFSYVGMKTQEVSISGNTDFQIQLQSASGSLDEVAIEHADLALRQLGVARVMGDHANGGAAFVQFVEQGHHGFATA